MWRITAFDLEGREVARLQVAGGEVTIGRDPDRHMVLPSAAVSRRHARLVLDGPQPYVSDEGSANGVILNGVRIAGPTAIVPGTDMAIAEFGLTFEKLPDTDAVSPIRGQTQAPSAAPDETMRLIAEGGPFAGRVYEIDDADVTVGRALENALVLDDPSLSRKHCRLRRMGQRIEFEDLGSSNGTYANGRRIAKGMVGPRDTVRFGDLLFRVEGPRGDGERRPLSPLWLWGGVAVGLVVASGIATILLVHRGDGTKETMAQLAQQTAQHLQNGKQRLSEKRFEAASREFDETLRLDPGNGEARRLKAQADAEPESRELATKVGVKAELAADRASFETATHLFAQIPKESTFRGGAEQKLGRKLAEYGLAQCKVRKWPDCEWGLVRAAEFGQAAPEQQAALKEAQRRLRKK